MRLRQIALAAPTLEPTVSALAGLLDLEVAYRDPGVAMFGLENALLPVGETFLEVVAPTRPDAPAARWLERRGGEGGGYMVIVQSPDLAEARARVDALGVRIAFEARLDDIATVHLHPRDVGGAILSIDEASPPESWRWGGPTWRAHRRTAVVTALAGAGLRVADPARVAARWSDVLGLDAPTRGTGREGEEHALALEDATLRFAAARGEPEGVASLDLREAAPGVLRERAEAAGLWRDADGDGFATVGGVALRPAPPVP